MNTLIKKSTIAVAVSVVLGSSAAWAEDGSDRSVSYYNDIYVDLDKTVDVYKDFDLEGDVKIKGLIQVDSNAMAIVDNKQLNHGNTVSTGDVEDPAFEASTTDITGNSGNVGINVTAGIYNQQDNAAAISSINNPAQAAAPDYLGSADAETFTYQSLEGKKHSPKTDGEQASVESTGDGGRYLDVDLIGASYNATTGLIDGNAGNIGVNVSAGVGNLQKNSLAIATGDSGLSEATAATLQETTGVRTQVTAAADQFGNIIVASYTATLGTVSNNTGNIGVNLASGSSNLQANSLALAVVQ